MTAIIFDTDPGIDDAMALLYLHAIPTFDLRLISTVFGNVSVAQCTTNALYICERFGIDVEVSPGAGLTVKGLSESDYPHMVHGEDGLGNIDAPPPSRQASERDAVAAMAALIEQHPGEIVLIAVGRLTNVANLVVQHPDVARELKEIVIMGGAYKVPGNVTAHAEANIIGDPDAAELVFASEIPLTMVGLDVTMETRMTEAYVEALRDGLGDVGDFVYRISRHYAGHYQKRFGSPVFPVHDASAVACAVDPGLFNYETGRLHCHIEGERRGFTEFTPVDGGPHKVCASVNSEAVLQHYLDTMRVCYGS